MTSLESEFVIPGSVFHIWCLVHVTEYGGSFKGEALLPGVTRSWTFKERELQVSSS